MVVLHIVALTNPSGNGVYAAVDEYIKYEKEYSDVALYSLRKFKDTDAYTIFNFELSIILSLQQKKIRNTRIAAK